MVKHLACYLTDHKQKSINSSWLEIAIWPQIWSLAPFILNVFTQIHHVFINEAIDTKTTLFNICHRQIWMEGVNQCQYTLIHFHEMHLVIKFKRTFYSCQWKRRSFPGTKRNSIWRPLITCASVRCRAWRNTLPCIRLIGTGNSCLTEACMFMPW